MDAQAREPDHPYPPGPPPRKGGLRSIPYYRQMLADPIGFVGERFSQYGDIYCAPNPDGHLYVLRHPDHLREVLVTRASSFGKAHTALTRMSRFLGEGLVVTDGETWRRHRRMLQPAFSRERLRGYAALMTDEAVSAASHLRDGAVIDLSDEMADLTMRVVCRTLFNHEMKGERERIAQAVVTLFGSATRPDIAPAWLPTPRKRRLARAGAEVDDFIYELYERRKRETADAHGGPRDLLRMLAAAVDEEGDGGRLSRKEVRDELLTFFFAGHETTSHALTWTLYLLSQHPRAEQRVHAEVMEVTGGAREVTYDDLAQMPYTKQCFKEAMRLYPPAYAVVRVASKDTQIGEYKIRRGSEVVCWIYMTHRDPRWFPDPDAFKPERFSPEAEARLPKQAYLPFGAGPRICIGKLFALIEARVILATLTRRFRFSLASGARVAIRTGVTLRPKYGMKMVVRARTLESS